MSTRDELVAVMNTAIEEAVAANDAFEALRKEGSATDLVKAAGVVAKATKLAEKAKHEADTFELIGVYEAIRAVAVKHVVGAIDVPMLAKHDVQAVTITVPVQSEPIEPDKIVVNTLGKRTVIKSGGNGTRTRYVYGPDKLNSRQLVEAYGADEVGEEKQQATLDEPSKHGLTHLADRIAKKLEFDKVPA